MPQFFCGIFFAARHVSRRTTGSLQITNTSSISLRPYSHAGLRDISQFSDN
jgi:hypothetical protein